MPLHDHTSSVLSLARTIRDGIDDSRTHTLVQNESLRLLISTLIEVSRPGHQRKMAEDAKRTVAGMIAPAINDDRTGGAGGWL